MGEQDYIGFRVGANTVLIFGALLATLDRHVIVTVLL